MGVLDLLKRKRVPKTLQNRHVWDEIRKEIDLKLKQVRIRYWIELFAIKNKHERIDKFRRRLERFYIDIFRKSIRDGKMTIPIKQLATRFGFPPKLENDLLWFNGLHLPLIGSRAG